MLEFRELTPDEFRLIPSEALGGFKLNPSIQRVSGLLTGKDKVSGIWVVGSVLHAEPIWIQEDLRKGPVIIPRLWDGVKTIVRDMGASGVLGVIPDSVPADKRIAEWLGATPIPGSLYMWLDKRN